MRQIFAKIQAEFRHNTYHHFIHFKSANDSIARVKLYDAMSSFGILAKLIRLVRMTMTNVSCRVKVSGKRAGPCVCLIFNMALERAMRDSRVESSGTIFYKSTQIMAYADDIDIIGLQSTSGDREPRTADKRGKGQTDGGNISGPTNNKSKPTWAWRTDRRTYFWSHPRIYLCRFKGQFRQ